MAADLPCQGRWRIAESASAPAGMDAIIIANDRIGIEQEDAAAVRRIDDTTLLVDWEGRQDWENLQVRRRGERLWVRWWHLDIPARRPTARITPDTELPGGDPIRVEDLLGTWRLDLDHRPVAAMAEHRPTGIDLGAVQDFRDRRLKGRAPGGMDLRWDEDGRVAVVRWSATLAAEAGGRIPLDGDHALRGWRNPAITTAGGTPRLTADDRGWALERTPLPTVVPDIDRRIRYAMRIMGVPGLAAAVIHPDGRAERWTLGARSRDGGPAITADDPFWLASCGKLFVGWIVLDLVAAGRVDLDAPVAAQWPGWAGASTATVADLLMHRAGLANPIADPTFQRLVAQDPGRRWGPMEPFLYAWDRLPQRDPGGAPAYANTSTDALIALCESVTATPFPELVRSRLLVPARAASTGFAPRPPGAPTGYRHTDPRHPIGYGTTLMDVSGFHPSWAGPGATMWSTVADLERLLPWVVDGRGLPPVLVRRRSAWFEGPGSARAHGLHLMRLGTLIGHAGDIPGGSALVARDGRSGAGIIVLCSLSNAADGSIPAVVIAQAIADLLPQRPEPIP